jgi:hypothetical protein
MKPQVFLSVGSATTQREEQATELVFRALATTGLSPLRMNKNTWNYKQPLKGIKEVIYKCNGIVVVAFQRYSFSAGAERQKDGSEKQLVNVKMPTVWNQIEAAIAYARGLPVFVLAETGLLEDGLLEGHYDWQVFWSDLSSEDLQSDRFFGFLESWKEDVIKFEESQSSALPSDIDLSKLSFVKLLGKLTIPQLWAMGSAITGILAGVATIAFRAGAGRWPWR